MERRLVEQAMHGDEGAFDALVDRFGDTLHSVARRILRDPSLAEDATQRALLDVWQNLPRLRDPDQFEAWAYRLLVNACHAEARHERRHRDNLRLLPVEEPSEVRIRVVVEMRGLEPLTPAMRTQCSPG